MRSFSRAASAVGFVLLSAIAFAELGCNQAVDDAIEELPASPQPAKEDGVGRAGLPVEGDYASTTAWTVKNQWEDRDTPEAKKAGMAWPEDSGLSWDEKYAKWVGGLEIIPAANSTWYETINISTPWGKSLPSPKLDCADATIMLRVSFAAWYQLPFFMVAGGNPTIYFGHFGIRTANGPWANGVALAQVHKDYSATPPTDIEHAWPKDAKMRGLHIHGKDSDGNWQDAMPYVVGKGEGTGAYLDELHLNKRAARLIYFMQLYMGSQAMVDTNNTFNLMPEALRTGDTLMYRRAPQGSGHTMVVVHVRQLEGGKLEAQDVFGNEPPDQLFLESPSSTRDNFMSDEGGGPSLSEDRKTPYSHIGGGLKRWRVAKAVNGRWMNTWMNGDKASWIDSTDYPRIEARPKQFSGLLGELPPLQARDELVKQIEDKREHLRNNPASCSARERREALFTKLRDLMSQNWRWSSQQVDAKYRTIEDYIYSPLVYTKSRTCCWNSSSRGMHESIMAFAAARSANMCIAPLVFSQTNGDYGEYAKYAADKGTPFPAWRADEECPQAGNTTDTVAESWNPAPPYCELPKQEKPANNPDHPAIIVDTVPTDVDGGMPGDADGGMPSGDSVDLGAP